MRYPADSRPVSLSLILAVLFLLSGCTALDRDNPPYAGESLPVQPPTPRDNNPDHLRLVPRYPSGWNYMEIKDYPALIAGSRQKLAYQYQRQGDTQTFKYSLENQPQQVSVRLGPIADTAVAATLNGKPIESDCITSGDSRWVWIRNISEKAGTIVITAKR